jgi:hypothetical protein
VAQKFTTGITVRDLASAASDAVAVSVAGDTNDRIKFEAGGKVVWGSGAAAGDVNLYRDAADRLKTDDALQADGGLITVTTAGTPTLSLPDGALAIDTTNNLLYIRTGGVWEIASGGGGASVTTSDGAPVDPEDGDLWYETDTGSMFVYYDDGASQQWVEVGTAGVIAMTTSDTAPSTPANGDLWFDTSTAKTYVYYDDGSSQQWVEVGAASAAASGTDGAIQYASGGTFSSDASNLVWDDTNNRLGIGTTTPAYKLDVAGDIHISNSTPYLIFTDTDTNAESRISASSGVGSLIIDADYNNEQAGTNIIFKSDGSERMRIDDSGRVGIGTTSPSAELDIKGASNPEIRLQSTDSSDPFLYFGDQVDAVRGGIGYDTSANALQLRGYNNSTRMTIDSSGNVGIGTTAPATLLHVSSGTSGDAELRISADTDNNNESDLPYLSLTADGGIIEGVVGLNDNTLVISNGVSSAQGIDFRTGTSNVYTTAADQVASTTSRLFINSSGNVGIGTTGPQTSLHVKRGTGITAANYSGEFAALIYHASNASTKHGLLVANQWIADSSTLIEAGNIYATNAAYTKMFYVTGYGRSYNYYGTWGTISDQTLKTDIVDAGNQLDDILGLRFVNYKFIKDVERDPETAPRLFGLVAQEVEQVSPGLVTEDGEGIKTVNTSVLSMKAVKAMQEMHAIIESQQTIISDLTARIEALEAN